jgi:hypothetical protein
VEAIYAAVYLLLAALVGLCGRRRRMGFVGFLVFSLLLTPPLGLLLVYLTAERPTAESSDPDASPHRW